MSAAETPEVIGIPRQVVWRWVIRVTVVVVMALLAWLVLWSYFGRFLPTQRQFVQNTATQMNLANEVQQLMLKWDELDAAQTGKRFDQSNASLFGGTNDCDLWLAGLRTHSLAMALNVAPRLGPADTNTHKNLNLALLRATVEIVPTAAAGLSNGPYHRLLGLARTVELSSNRADLLELTATGQSNSVERASAVFQLWSHSSPPK